MKKIFYIIFFVLMLHSNCFTQDLPNILLTQVSEENGLSDNHVQCVLKDSKGFVWIGTADGLNLMDGSAITVYKHDADNSSLLFNNISSLIEDKKSNIWIGTSLGLCCYVRNKNIFFGVSIPSSKYGASNIVNNVFVDAKNNIWCCTDGGLFVYDTTKKLAQQFLNKSNNEELSTINKIKSAWFDRDEEIIWLGTFDGLWQFDIKTTRYKRVVSKSNDPHYQELTSSVFEDKKKQLWFGNWSAGLKQLDIKTNKIISYDYLPNAKHNITAINEMYLTNGKTVLCLNGELSCFIKNDAIFSKFTKPILHADYPAINNYYQSDDGWLWMGSDKGLYIYNPNRQFFQHHFFVNDITSQGLNFIEYNNQLLVGAEGKKFLNAYDVDWHEKNSFSQILKSSSAINHKNESTLCLVKENDNSLLIGNTGGILKYNLLNGKSIWFIHNKKDSSSIPSNFIDHIFIDSKKQCWIFPWREGIYNMDVISGKCTLRCKGFIRQEKNIKGLLISSAVEDEQGNIWMADLDEGIILFDRKNNAFSKPFEKQIGSRTHSTRVIYKNGFCYSFANNKLLKWNTTTKQLELITVPQQISNNIADFCLDNKSNFWVGTQKSLISLEENKRTFKTYTVADGLIENDMVGNFYLRNNGDIVFGKPNYISQFNPAALLNNFPTNAQIIITSIEANGKKIAYDSNNAILLNYPTNNLLFKWTITDYLNPFHNQYYCMLNGIDIDWKYVGNKGEMQYANLSFGKYTLLLKAATANGIESNKILKIRFKILPPFWKTWLFWALIFTSLSSLIFWLVYKRIKNIKAKAAIKQQMSELEMKALRAQMNPHFIFNALTSIQDSIVNNKTDAASKYLGKFSKLLRIVLENSGAKFISLKDEISYLQLYLEIESFRFEDLHFDIVCNLDDPAFIKIPPMIVQPYIENALKHGLAHKLGEKKLSVFFYQNQNEKLIAKITDNGVGRAKSEVINKSRLASHQSMGMKITEQRLSLLNNEDKKQIEIIDLYNENKNPIGTTVKVVLPTIS